MDLSNFDLESHVMSVTCIIKLIILQTTHNILDISYHTVHIILSYAMRPWIMDLTLGLPKMRAQHM